MRRVDVGGVATRVGRASARFQVIVFLWSRIAEVAKATNAPALPASGTHGALYWRGLWKPGPVLESRRPAGRRGAPTAVVRASTKSPWTGGTRTVVLVARLDAQTPHSVRDRIVVDCDRPAVQKRGHIRASQCDAQI